MGSHVKKVVAAAGGTEGSKQNLGRVQVEMPSIRERDEDG